MNRNPQADRPAPSHPILLLVTGAVLISFSPVFVKNAFLDGLGPTSIAFWRLALGTVPLFALASARKAPLIMPRRLLAAALLAGAVFTADLYLWHRAIPIIGAGMATILGNTQVFNTAILTWIIFREKPAGVFFPAAALGLAGVILLVGVGGGTEFHGRYLVGVVFGLCTGVAYAVYLVTTRSMARSPVRPPVLTMVAWISLMGSACSLAVCAIENDAFLPASPAVWWNLIGLGILVQAAGWWAITIALPGVPGATAGLILLLQPVLATVWGRLLFTETLDPVQFLGAALTLGAIYLGTGVGSRAKAKP